jgi:large subunit ribosomal protein L29
MRTKIKELREKSSDELATDRQQLREEALTLRIQQESGQLENPARIREVRREVARINTLIAERHLAAAEVEVAELTADAAGGDA